MPLVGWALTCPMSERIMYGLVASQVMDTTWDASRGRDAHDGIRQERMTLRTTLDVLWDPRGSNKPQV